VTVDGDIEACIRAEYKRLVRVVSLVTGSTPLAEEAVQEAFARAWERALHGYRFDHLAGWVATVALNQARSGRRRKASEQRAVARLAAAPLAASDAGTEAAIVLRSAVDGLARRQRDAVVLYYLLDMDVVTVAALLRVSEGTVKSALARARQRLAVMLEEELET
jgi:RNA polymerase sigma-70 factor (ECF subfamily)